ncbi:amidase [Streptomyces sp. NPDC001380]|uniref:amidase n=1 Tax=Streptomyces sp. NPDC001380 TaxID=3364566 RepID=UPI0036B585B7
MSGDTHDGLAAQARALADGLTSSRLLVEEALRRIEATQPVLNAFRRVRTEAALAEADAADRRLAAGERLPLLGVPIAVKDDTDVAGEPTAFGCAGEFPVREADAEAVRRLREAGAVVVGKTNTPELGQWPFTEGPAFGETRNPWSTGHTPGGSSGGAAAAVAAGVVPAALGSDGAGSVRIPAAWTNLVGIKPQRGRISAWPEPESFHGLTGLGPLARTVADAALLLDAAAGSHPRDRHRPDALPLLPHAGRDPGRLRIALSLRPPFTFLRTPLDPHVRDAVVRLAGALARLGHDVAPFDLPYGPVGPAFVPRGIVGVADWCERVPDPELLDPRTRGALRSARLLRGPALRAARAAEEPLRRRYAQVFDRFDVVLTPTTAVPPLPIGAMAGWSGSRTDRAMIAACPYTWPWNVVGWPAVGVPAGFTPAGLPVGAQLLGPHCGEPRLVSLAAQLEADRRWHERRPPVHTGRNGQDGRGGQDRPHGSAGTASSVPAARREEAAAVGE